MPTVDEERLALARQRAGLRPAGPWRGSRLIPRLIFFGLTLVCVGAFTGLMALFDLPQEFLTFIAAIAVGEALIRGKKLFHAGPEEALWIAGAIALLFSLPGSPGEESLLLLAGAFLGAGIRLRNALFMAAAAPLVCVYMALELDPVPASFLSLAAAFTALALVNRHWRDPLIERLLSWLIVVMPLLAWAIDAVDEWRSGHWRFRVVLGLVVAAILLAIGILRRHRVTVISGALCAAVSLFDLDQRLMAAGEMRFLLWGAGLLLVTFAIIRALRRERGGITSAKVEELEGYALVEVAAASVVTPRAPETQRPIGEGGQFGGGGASGEY